MRRLLLVVLGVVSVALVLGWLADRPAQARRTADRAYLATITPAVTQIDGTLHALQADGPTADTLAALQTEGVELQAPRNPPPEMAAVDSNLTGAGGDLVRLAADDASPTARSAATADLQSINRHLQTINQELQRVGVR
jgi:hypothetical protein